MVGEDLVVQGQRVVALAPVVADPLVPVDHQGIDVELAEPGGDAKSGLPTADDDRRRLPSV